MVALQPGFGVVDRFGANVELSGQCFNKFFSSFYLEIARSGGLVVGYNADANSVTATVPGSPGYD